MVKINRQLPLLLNLVARNSHKTYNIPKLILQNARVLALPAHLKLHHLSLVTLVDLRQRRVQVSELCFLVDLPTDILLGILPRVYDPINIIFEGNRKRGISEFDFEFEGAGQLGEAFFLGSEGCFSVFFLWAEVHLDIVLRYGQ